MQCGRVRRTIGWVMLGLLVALYGACAASEGAGDQEVEPEVSVEATAPLLLPGEIEILVDPMGIPHIYGGTDEDVFFGYGYQVTSDRAFQLALFRRQALGRSAEVLGEPGLLRDRYARVFNWRDWGRLDAAWMAEHEPERYGLIEAYVAGINRRVAEIREGVVDRPFGFGPDEYDFLPEPWTAEDVYVVQKLAAFTLDLTIEFEIFLTFAHRLFPDLMADVDMLLPARDAFGLHPDELPEMPPMTAAGPRDFTPARGPAIARSGLLGFARDMAALKHLGSNNWAVDGRHTDNGRPLFAGDPHMRFDYSGLVYAIHLNSADSAGRYDVAGFAFVGAPGIAMGHNRHVVWSPTSNFADVMDMWEVAITGDGALVAGETAPVTVRQETIIVRGEGDAVGQGAPFSVSATDVEGYGIILPFELVGLPIPIADAGKEVLIGWTGYAQRPARYFLELNDAESVDAFEAAVERLPEMSYNFVAADAHGIRYRVGLDVPLRPTIGPGTEPWLLMDGWDAASAWTGELLPHALLPRSDGGERGWIATANTDPYGFTADGRVDDDPFYWGGFFAPGWRLGRIQEELDRLTDRGQVTLEDMKALQMDTHSNLADDLMPVLQASWASAMADPALAPRTEASDTAALYALLMGWDREMVRDSAGALAFQAFATSLTHGVLADDLPLLFDVVMDMHGLYLMKIAMLALTGGMDTPDRVLQEGADVAILDALETTAAFLRDEFGAVEPATYAYGDLHVIRLDGGFGIGLPLMDVAADGGISSVNVAPGNAYANGELVAPWATNWIPMDRIVASFDADGRPRVEVNFPLGNVADPTSPHFDDQLTAWTDGVYQPLLFERTEIVAAAESTRQLAR